MNGMSGGFQIAKTSLEELLATFVDPTIVVGHSPYRRPFTVADVQRLLQQFPSREVWIEEQDHRWYIMHLDWPVGRALSQLPKSGSLYRPAHRCSTLYIASTRSIREQRAKG
jgi:hypothetical protein